MFFIAAKLLAFLLTPSDVVPLLVIIGALLMLSKRQLSGRILLSIGLCLMAAIAWSPLAFWLLMPLESRHPAPSIRPPVTGIILLGGAVDIAFQPRESGPLLTHAGGRLLTTVALAHRFPAAKILISGGSPELNGREARSEAVLTKAFLAQMGIDPDRMLTDSASRDTYENAQEAAKLLQPKPTDQWLLVTSAVHMPRALGAFSAMNFPVIPYPADYKTGADASLARLPDTAAQGWLYCDVATHEWLGLLAYRLSGRTSVFLP
ncbi:YdcF family protein [Dongia soli]|uniref:YdcF family protein n=1 Tax=Dongia soli TaxID=600628 RepID=A0ABU5E979_9PROT|nr:YdcF family protein [Dongia soli]MDY0882779.1 YdcF family protein [Dongia soli]